MDPPTRVFDMLQCFETILPSVESLWYSLQDEVYFMGGGAAGTLEEETADRTGLQLTLPKLHLAT